MPPHFTAKEVRCTEENGGPKPMDSTDQNFPRNLTLGRRKESPEEGHVWQEKVHKSLTAYHIAKLAYPYFLAFVWSFLYGCNTAAGREERPRRRARLSLVWPNYK